MVISPFGEPISWAERLRFYADIDSVTGLPIMLYNTPPAGLMTMAQVEALAALEHVSAIKDSSGDVVFLGDLLAFAGEQDLAVYVGYDSLLTFAAASGARGVLFGVANLVPEALIAAMRASEAGDHDMLARIWPPLRALLRFMEDCSNYVALCKAGVTADGLDVGDVRPPFLMPDANERRDLQAHLAAVSDAFGRFR